MVMGMKGKSHNDKIDCGNINTNIHFLLRFLSV
jgi:hypothetical protein